jgi:antitoxin component of MazEF toxin-antitoxin module
MAKVTIGKWGKNAALRLPVEIMKATGLKIGEEVEVGVAGLKVIVTRPHDVRRAEAEAAAERIIKRSKGHSLRGLSIRDLINEGRKY